MSALQLFKEGTSRFGDKGLENWFSYVNKIPSKGKIFNWINPLQIFCGASQVFGESLVIMKNYWVYSQSKRH